jgi:hypothetical protein
MERTMPGPISPDKIGEAKGEVYPSFVFDAFNELIAQDYSNGYATVKQNDVIDRILDKQGISGEMVKAARQEIFNKGWLNVEETYRAVGWKVEYDKPGYNESYQASFKFRK